MTVVARIERTVSTDEAVELIWERVLAGEFADSAEAARAMWHSFSFAADDRDFLALYGLIELAKKEQRQTRSYESPRPALGWGVPHGRKWDQYIALTWVYAGADGSAKPLFDFDDADVAAFTVAWATAEDAARRRREFGELIARHLKEHEVKRVRDLPLAVLAEVNQAALEAMGRQP